MSPHPSQRAVATIDLRQMAHLPRESDGVGVALRQIFTGKVALPSDFNALLGRLDKTD